MNLTDYEQTILKTIAMATEKGLKEIGHRELADHFNERNPKLFNGLLMRLHQ